MTGAENQFGREVPQDICICCIRKVRPGIHAELAAQSSLRGDSVIVDLVV